MISEIFKMYIKNIDSHQKKIWWYFVVVNMMPVALLYIIIYREQKFSFFAFDSDYVPYFYIFVIFFFSASFLISKYISSDKFIEKKMADDIDSDYFLSQDQAKKFDKNEQKTIFFIRKYISVLYLCWCFTTLGEFLGFFLSLNERSLNILLILTSFDIFIFWITFPNSTPLADKCYQAIRQSNDYTIKKSEINSFFSNNLNVDKKWNSAFKRGVVFYGMLIWIVLNVKVFFSSVKILCKIKTSFLLFFPSVFFGIIIAILVCLKNEKSGCKKRMHRK